MNYKNKIKILYLAKPYYIIREINQQMKRQYNFTNLMNQKVYYYMQFTEEI